MFRLSTATSPHSSENKGATLHKERTLELAPVQEDTLRQCPHCMELLEDGQPECTACGGVTLPKMLTPDNIDEFLSFFTSNRDLVKKAGVSSFAEFVQLAHLYDTQTPQAALKRAQIEGDTEFRHWMASVLPAQKAVRTRSQITSHYDLTGRLYLQTVIKSADYGAKRQPAVHTIKFYPVDGTIEYDRHIATNPKDMAQSPEQRGGRIVPVSVRRAQQGVVYSYKFNNTDPVAEELKTFWKLPPHLFWQTLDHVFQKIAGDFGISARDAAMQNLYLSPGQRKIEPAPGTFAMPEPQKTIQEQNAAQSAQGAIPGQRTTGNWFARTRDSFRVWDMLRRRFKILSYARLKTQPDAIGVVQNYQIDRRTGAPLLAIRWLTPPKQSPGVSKNPRGLTWVDANLMEPAESGAEYMEPWQANRVGPRTRVHLRGDVSRTGVTTQETGQDAKGQNTVAVQWDDGTKSTVRTTDLAVVPKQFR